MQTAGCYYMKLLIVDDSRMILKHAETILKNANVSPEIMLAKSGREAFEILEDQEIDIVVLDIIMPEISGIEVLRRIKSDQKLMGIKVLMFSSLVDKKTLQECFKIGATDYITKPLEEIEFLARVKSVIKEKELENELLNRFNINQSLDEVSENRTRIKSQLYDVNEHINSIKSYISKYNLLLELYQTYRLDMQSCETEKTSGVSKAISDYEQKNNFTLINKHIEKLIETALKDIESMENNI